MRKPRMLVWGNDHQPAWDGEGEEEGPVTLLVGGKILDPAILAQTPGLSECCQSITSEGRLLEVDILPCSDLVRPLLCLLSPVSVLYWRVNLSGKLIILTLSLSLLAFFFNETVNCWWNLDLLGPRAESITFSRAQIRIDKLNIRMDERDIRLVGFTTASHTYPLPPSYFRSHKNLLNFLKICINKSNCIIIIPFSKQYF